jgi:predicted aspartyl protease
MPIFPLPLRPDGPQLDVGVSVSRTYAPWGGPPGTWQALIDTGASMTAISPGVVAALQPLRLGAQPVRRAGGGSTWHYTYEVRIRFGGHSVRGRWFNLEAVEIQPATPEVDILIGMDLLLKIDMGWLGPRRLLFLSY